MFAFKSADGKISDERAAIEAHYEDMLLHIDCDGDEDGEKMYRQLLGRLYEASGSRPVRMQT